MKLERAWCLVFGGALGFGSACGGASTQPQGAGGDMTGAGGQGGGLSCPAGSHLEGSVCRSHITGWSAGPALPAAVDHHVTFIAEGPEVAHLFVAGGFDGSQVVNTVLRTTIDDGTVGAWQTLAPLPEAMSGQGLAVLDDQLVLTGGRRTNFAIQPTTNIGRITEDGELQDWTVGPPMQVSRFHHSTEVHNGAIYAIGGLVGDGSANTERVGRLTGLDGAWEDVTPLPAPRSHHCSLVHEGRIYVLGGLTGNPAGAHTSHRDVLRADVSAGGDLGDWQHVSDLPATLATHACFVDMGYLYVVGGVRDGSTFTEEVLRAALDDAGQLGAWETQPSLPLGRAHTHQTPRLDGFIYSAGGRRDGQGIADVFVGAME